MRLEATLWLAHLDDARTLALAGDAEGVHQVRVSLRRLRVWLSFKGHPGWEEELRWLCSELALLRDLDVFGDVLTAGARAGLRPKAVKRAVTALESKRFHALRDALWAVSSPRRSRAKRVLPKLERAWEKRRDRLRKGDGEAIHRLRRALRRVRYAREWLGLDTAEVAAEQEQLGALCDLLALRSFAHGHGVDVPAALNEAITKAFEWLEARA